MILVSARDYHRNKKFKYDDFNEKFAVLILLYPLVILQNMVSLSI